MRLAFFQLSFDFFSMKAFIKLVGVTEASSMPNLCKELAKYFPSFRDRKVESASSEKK